MKLGICGAQGSGKSTEALKMTTKLKIENPNKRVFLLQENVINCPLPINKESTFESQLWIIADQMKAEIEACSKYDIVVCDRTVFDPIVYGIVTGLINQSDVIFKFLKEYAYTYDTLYLMRAKEIYLKDDGLRSMDIQFQRDVDQEFLKLVHILDTHKYVKNVKYFINNP